MSVPIGTIGNTPGLRRLDRGKNSFSSKVSPTPPAQTTPKVEKHRPAPAATPARNAERSFKEATIVFDPAAARGLFPSLLSSTAPARRSEPSPAPKSPAANRNASLIDDDLEGDPCPEFSTVSAAAPALKSKQSPITLSRELSTPQIPDEVWPDETGPAAALSLKYQFFCALNTAAQTLLSLFYNRLSSFAKQLPPDARRNAVLNLGTPGAQINNKSVDEILGFFAKKHPELSVITYDAVFSGSPLPSTKFVAIPIFTATHHTTLLLLEKKGEEWAVEFYDSQALPLNHPQNRNALDVYNQLQTTGEQLKKPHQYDQHNSGVFVCWFLEERLKGKTFKDIQAQSPDIERYRHELGQRLANAPTSVSTKSAVVIDEWDAEADDFPSWETDSPPPAQSKFYDARETFASIPGFQWPQKAAAPAVEAPPARDPLDDLDNQKSLLKSILMGALQAPVKVGEEGTLFGKYLYEKVLQLSEATEIKFTRDKDHSKVVITLSEERTIAIVNDPTNSLLGSNRKLRIGKEITLTINNQDSSIVFGENCLKFEGTTGWGAISISGYVSELREASKELKSGSALLSDKMLQIKGIYSPVSGNLNIRPQAFVDIMEANLSQ